MLTSYNSILEIVEEDLFGAFCYFSFLLANVESFQWIKCFSGRKCPATQRFTISELTAPIINLSFFFFHILLFDDSINLPSCEALGAIIGVTLILGTFWFTGRNPFKEKENLSYLIYFTLESSRKVFQVFKLLMVRYEIADNWLSLRLSCGSMSRLGSPVLYQQSGPYDSLTCSCF